MKEIGKGCVFAMLEFDLDYSLDQCFILCFCGASRLVHLSIVSGLQNE